MNSYFFVPSVCILEIEIYIGPKLPKLTQVFETMAMQRSLQNRDHRTVLSKITIRRYVDMFNGNEFCFMCRSLLRNKVFENGVDLCEGSGNGPCRASMNPRTKRLLEDYWIPFAKAAMDMIFCIGLVPVRFIRVDENSVPIPYVPIVGTYDIHIVTTNAGIRSYELFDTDSGLEPVEDSLVLAGFNYDPLIDGQMTSLVAILEPVFRFIAELSDAAMISEKIRCNPPVLIQKRDTSNSQQEKETANFGFYADTDNIKVTEQNQYQRNEMQIKQLQNQQRMFVTALYPTQGQKNAKNAMDNMVPLPSQFQVASLVEPSGRTDFVSVNRMAQETICSTLGVPRSLFINDHVVRSDQEGIHETLRQSLIYWKQTIAKIMSKLWFLCNEESVLKKVMKDAKKSKRALQGIALETHLQKKMPRLEIPITPYSDSVQLRMLYLQEVITWETYATYLLRNASLPVEVLGTKKDPWTHEDKKLLLGIKPEPVKPVEPLPDRADKGSSSGSTDEQGTRAKQSSRVGKG